MLNENVFQLRTSLSWNVTALILVIAGCIATSATAQSPPVFVDATPLPDVTFQGERLPIHVQGLYVTETSFIVTGRTETPPKRPLLLRFSRKDVSQYELAWLTLASDANVSLDHPGGFDRDENGVFWIPVSTSGRRGPTIVLGITIDEERPLAEAISVQHSFVVADHLGAICCTPNDTLLAANWDTESIIEIGQRNAGLRISRNVDWSTLANQPNWKFAVQDWKWDTTSKKIMAGGIDKAKRSDVDGQSNAQIALIDVEQQSATTFRIPQRTDVARPLTNEGMAISGNELFVLPEDIGGGAKILRFHWDR